MVRWEQSKETLALWCGVSRYSSSAITRSLSITISLCAAASLTACSHTNPPRTLRGHGYRLSIPDESEQQYRQVPFNQAIAGRVGETSEGAALDPETTSNGDEINEIQPNPELLDSHLLTQSTERVVAFLPVSGNFAAMGKAIELGLPCGLQGEGGSLPPAVTVVDAAGDEVATSRALRDTIQKGPRPLAIVGPFISSQIPLVTEIARDFSLPSFNLAKEAASKGDTVIDLGFSLPAQISAIVRDGIQRARIKRLAIARTPTELSTKTADELRRGLEGSGVTVVFDGTYGDGGEFSGVRELIQKLEETPVDGLFVADTVQGAGRLLSSLGNSLRGRITVFGPGAWYNASALRNAQDAFNGVVFPVPLLAQEEQPLFKKLARCLPAKRDRNGDFLAALGFDVGTIVALRGEGRLGLYKGLTGSFGLEENGVSRTVPVGIYTDGVIRPYSPIIRSLADVLPTRANDVAQEKQAPETSANDAI